MIAVRATSLVLASALVAACTGPAGTLAAQRDAPGSAEDIRFLLSTMDSMHPNPYRVHSKEAWRAAADRLEQRLPELAYHQILLGLHRLSAMAADGHTGMGILEARLDGTERAARGISRGEALDTVYPIRYGVFADGLYVLRSRSERSLLGKRVVAINGRSTADAVESVLPFVPADHRLGAYYRMPEYLRSPAVLHAAGLSSAIDAPVVLSLVDAEGPPFEHALAPIDVESDAGWDRVLNRAGNAAAYPPLRRFDGNYGFEYWPDSRTVYLRYRQVRDAGDESIAQFATRLFAFVESNAVDRLVIDVRGNGGGNGYLNQPLILGLIGSRKINRPGKLFTITDPGTFSAAVMFVADLESNTHTLFVGEPPGAPNNHHGDATTVTLPRSGLLLRVSSLHWQMGDPRDQRMAIIPDIPAQVSFDDYVAGTDPALEAINRYEHRSAPAQAPNRNWMRPNQRAGWNRTIRW